MIRKKESIVYKGKKTLNLKCFKIFFFCCDFCWNDNTDLHNVYPHGFPPKVFFRFSGWCASCKMIQPLCPNWCNILIFFLIYHMYWKFISWIQWLCYILYCSGFYLPLLLLPIPLTCSDVLWRVMWREGKSRKLFSVWNSVFGYGTDKTQVKL